MRKFTPISAPLHRPTRRSGGVRLWWLFAGAAVCLGLAIASQAPFALGQADSPKADGSANRGKKSSETRRRDAPADDNDDSPISAVDANLPSGSMLLKEAHAFLLSRRTIQAEVLEVASLTDPPLRMTGRYVSAGVKLRLEFDVQLPGSAGGQLVEVCDGERLWSWLRLPGAERVTRRDIRQILAAAERATEVPTRSATVDLALGGLPALVTSLDRAMNFDHVKQEVYEDQAVWVLMGRWTPELALQLGGNANAPKFPAHIPEAARLTLTADSLMPVRLQYLKRQPRGAKLLLDLKFHNIRLDEPVSDHEFSFSPPDGVEPEDITRQYLSELLPKAGPGSATETEPAPATAPTRPK